MGGSKNDEMKGSNRLWAQNSCLKVFISNTATKILILKLIKNSNKNNRHIKATTLYFHKKM